jgi:hypothetical protein
MHLLRREQGVAITPIAFRPNRLGNRGHGLDPGPPTEHRPFPPTPLFRMGNSLLAVLGPNLIDSFRRVQQLLVRVIFLPGISDSSKPIRHLTFRCANLFADAEPALQTARIKQTTTVSSASSAGTWALFCEGTDYGPAATTASQGCLTRRLP